MLQVRCRRQQHERSRFRHLPRRLISHLNCSLHFLVSVVIMCYSSERSVLRDRIPPSRLTALSILVRLRHLLLLVVARGMAAVGSRNESDRSKQQEQKQPLWRHPLCTIDSALRQAFLRSPTPPVARFPLVNSASSFASPCGCSCMKATLRQLPLMLQVYGLAAVITLSSRPTATGGRQESCSSRTPPNAGGAIPPILNTTLLSPSSRFWAFIRCSQKPRRGTNSCQQRRSVVASRCLSAFVKHNA